MESNAPALSWAGSCAGRDNTVYTQTTNNYSPRVSKVGPPGHDLNCAGGGAVTVAGENGNAKKETLARWYSGYTRERRKRKRRRGGGRWPGLDSDRRILPTVSSVFCSCDRFKTNLFFWLAFHWRGLFSPIFSFSGRYVPKTFKLNFIFGITYIIFFNLGSVLLWTITHNQFFFSLFLYFPMVFKCSSFIYVNFKLNEIWININFMNM